MQPAIEFQNHRMMRNIDPVVEDTEPQRISFPAVLGALRRRKRLFVVTFAILMALVVGVLLVLPARYTATASIEVAAGETRNLTANPVARGLADWMPGDNSIMATQIAMIKTPALATQVADKLKLSDDREFRPLTQGLEEDVAALVQHWFPSRWQDLIPWNADVGSGTRREEAAQHLTRQLSVEQEGTSHVISVGFTSSDANKAAKIANAVGEQYLDNQIAAKHRAIERAYDWATAQVAEQHQRLLQAETAAIDYMAANGLEASNGLSQPAQPPPYKSDIGGLPVQQLTNLQDELGAAHGRLAADQAKLNEINAMSAKGSGYDSLPEVASSPAIAALKGYDAQLGVTEAQLGSTYNMETPVLDRVRAQRRSIAQRIATETQTIVQGIRNEATIERGRVAQLELLMSKGRDQYATIERASVKLRELNREAGAKRVLYERLLAKTNEIGEQLALVQPDGAIISPAAVPRQPSSPSKFLIGCAGFIGSLIFGIIFAGLAEYSDHTLRTARQVEQTLGTHNLGLVPLLTRRDYPGIQQPYLAVSRQPLSMYAEAVRSIVLQLINRQRGQPQVIMVTSALPGEGKTTMTMSLAAAAARFGRRTVLVDLDFRYPSVEFMAKLSLKADLQDYIRGTATLDQTIYPDPQDSRLHLIPLRTSAGGAADELHTCNLEELIEKLRVRYECIFIDLPPSLALSDIQAVDAIVDETLFVVQWGKTSRSAATEAMSALANIGVAVAGVVLTQVDLPKYATYGYEQVSKYYSRGLSYFHGSGASR